MSIIYKQDQLVFDFLEGNLNPEEREAFLMLRDESEVLDREVRLWQNTYVDAPLPNVDALEAKLFIHTGNHGTNFLSRIYSILVIAVIGIFLPANDSLLYTRDTVSVVADGGKTTEQIPTEAPAVVADCEHRNPMEEQPRGKRIKGDYSPEHQILVTTPVALAGRRTEILLTSPEVVPSHDLEIITNQYKPTVSDAGKKKWSRRELRMIRKKRWSDHQNRLANEFQRGREPYVVPLNSNNF